MKKCKCGAELPPTRVYTKCQPCASAYFKEYRLNNLERIQSQKAETYQLKKLIKSRKQK